MEIKDLRPYVKGNSIKKIRRVWKLLEKVGKASERVERGINKLEKAYKELKLEIKGGLEIEIGVRDGKECNK